MKNKERFHHEIFETACMGSRVAVSKETGKVYPCPDLGCSECLFYSSDLNDKGCVGRCKEWCEEEYQVDWSSVKVDTPILVSDHWNSSSPAKRHFAEYKDGIVYAFSSGKTSFSDDGCHDVISWKYAKLAEGVEVGIHD